MEGLSGKTAVKPSYAHSVHSTVAESEQVTLSEADELHEIKNLQEIGRAALDEAHHQEALAAFRDALEIDENNLSSLCGRAAVYVEMEKYILAQQDAEKALETDPNNPQAHYLQATALGHLGYHKESLLAFLRALNLDEDSEHADMLTNNVARMASKYCHVPEEFLANLSQMDAYRKLCEIGVFLHLGKKYEMSIRVLDTARKQETNQQGITMKVQLTLATAHGALKHNELAISLYQECLVTAIAAHDAQYQTKALVSIASLFMETHDTHQAIVYYEKLLDLQQELQGEDPSAPLPDYWNDALQCALHLNLSVAYKNIENIQEAVRHATKYVELIENKKALGETATAHSHQNIGTLYSTLGRYKEALQHFKTFLSQSKTNSDKKGIAQAYGCLGGCYARLNNAQISKTYHEQHIAMARKLQDTKMQLVATELYGDSLMILEDLDKAIEIFMDMFKLCQRTHTLHQTTALMKAGKCYKMQRRFQYGIYYFEQAKMIAEDFEFTEIRRQCEFNLAAVMQHSTQMFELDQAKKYFEDLIPIFEAKVKQHEDEDSFCSEELQSQLKECYLGMQTVLAKLGNKEECLCYSEAHKGKLAPILLTSATPRGLNVPGSHAYQIDLWSLEKISRVVSQQNSTVLYYSVLPASILLWVLQPGEGLVRFYSGGLVKPGGDLNDTILNLLRELKNGRKNMVYDCENRALPLPNTEVELIRKKNKELSKASKQLEYIKELEKDVEEKKLSEKEKLVQQKTCARKLFDLLVAPVEDILSQLEEGSPVVVVPDRALYQCPFSVLQDWSGKSLGEKYRLTCVPNLHVLDKAVQSELNQLRVQDELGFERVQSRAGGIPKVLSTMEHGRAPAHHHSNHRQSTVTNDSLAIDYKRTSNPRLASSGAVTSAPKPPPTALGISRENTFLSLTSKRSPKSSRSRKTYAGTMSTAIPSPCRTAIGSPTKAEKLAAAHSLSTLTTRTSTGTDITSSDCVVTDYRQVSDQDCCLVIGAPKLPESVLLHGQPWTPYSDLALALKECYAVSDYLEVKAVTGETATKNTFLREIQKASVIHIATLACLKEGYIIMCPNPTGTESGPPSEHSYIVTIEDILACTLVAKLVVISGGWSSVEREVIDMDGHKLASSFITAGAQCVLTCLWPIPNAALDIFYKHFYSAFLENHYVFTATKMAMAKVKENEKYSNVSYWSSMVVIGKDVRVDLKHIFHAQLDQTLDRVEKEVAGNIGKDPLNPPALTPHDWMTEDQMYEMELATREEGLHELQKCMSLLLQNHATQSDVLSLLVEMLDYALKRLHTEDMSQRYVCLPEQMLKSSGGMGLLRLLGFHFQSRGQYTEEPYVIFPHWNKDEFLVPVYDALRSLQDIVNDNACSEALYELLPTQQETISYMVDVFCITKHASDIQLKVSDISVRPLWKSPPIKKLLTSIGFHQIGLLLSFNTIPSNRRLLHAALQLLIALSVHKSTILLHKLDINLLGGPVSSKTSTVSLEAVRLPSLTPILLPRSQLRMSTPWLSTVEKTEEMDEKMKLAKSQSDMSAEYQAHTYRARTWHQSSLGPQADVSLDKVGRPKVTPSKVKVIAGGSTSCPRIPVDKVPDLTLPQTEERRDDATYILTQRLDNIALRHRDDVRKLYLPYLQPA